MLTPAANPSLSFPLISGRAVEKNLASSPASAQVAQLTRRLAAGDENAFQDFHAQYFDRLFHFLLVVCRGHEQEAQEALQQTLLRVVRYVRGFDSEEVFWSWLKALARSTARDANRKQRRYSALLERVTLYFGRWPAENGTRDEDQLSAVLEEVLAELPLSEQQLLRSKYIEGLTVKELCAQTGFSQKAIESRLDRLRRAVRERILKKLATS